MKKVLVSILTMFIMLCGCSNKNEDSILEVKIIEDDYYGIWVTDSIKEDGVVYSMEELIKLGNEQLKDFYFLFKEGGAGYIYSEILGYDNSVSWQFNNEDSSVKMEELTFKFTEKGLTIIISEDNEMYLKRYSTSQDITRIPKSDEIVEEEPAKEELIEETPVIEDGLETKVQEDTIRSEVKEAIDTYEEFIDEYCIFIKKYENADPSDFALIAEYTTFVAKLSEMEQKMSKLEGDLNDKEALYYAEVMLRCSNKLLNAAY